MKKINNFCVLLFPIIKGKKYLRTNRRPSECIFSKEDDPSVILLAMINNFIESRQTQCNGDIRPDSYEIRQYIVSSKHRPG